MTIKQSDYDEIIEQVERSLSLKEAREIKSLVNYVQHLEAKLEGSPDKYMNNIIVDVLTSGHILHKEYQSRLLASILDEISGYLYERGIIHDRTSDESNQ